MFKGERYAQIHRREWPIERVYEVPASAYRCDATIRSQWTSVGRDCDTAHNRRSRQNSHYDYPVKYVRQYEPFRRHVHRFQVHGGVKYGSPRCVEADKNERWCWERPAAGGMRSGRCLRRPEVLVVCSMRRSPSPPCYYWYLGGARCHGEEGAREVLLEAACHVQPEGTKERRWADGEVGNGEEAVGRWARDSALTFTLRLSCADRVLAANRGCQLAPPSDAMAESFQLQLRWGGRGLRLQHAPPKLYDSTCILIYR
jgi:hypothetical protein